MSIFSETVSAAQGRIADGINLWTAVIVVVIALSGCGGSKTQGVQQETTTPVANGADTNTVTPQNTVAAAPKVDPNKKETKWIGDIPYDVFYDQPLTIAADSTTIGGTPTTNTSVTESSNVPVETPMKTPTPTETASSSSGAATATDWAAVLPMPVLVEEVKLLRTRLNAALQTVSTYNRAVKEISLDAAMLSAMAGIATVHSEDVSWKGNAKYIRDLAYEVYSQAEGTGRSSFTACSEPFETIKTLLDGSQATDLEAEDIVEFGDVVYVSEMMKRIEISFNALNSNIITDARLKEEAASVERELRVLAVFGKLMLQPCYDSADEKKYQGFVNTFVDGAMSGVDAVKTENLDGLRSALATMQNTCAECHQQYRGSDSGF